MHSTARFSDYRDVLQPFMDGLSPSEPRIPGYALNVVPEEFRIRDDKERRRWWARTCKRAAAGERPVLVYLRDESWRFVMPLTRSANCTLEYTAELHAEGFAIHVQETLCHNQARADERRLS